MTSSQRFVYPKVCCTCQSIDENNSEVNLSFNPKQARILGEYLQVAGEEQEKSGYNTDYYGNIDVDYEFANDNIEIPF